MPSGDMDPSLVLLRQEVRSGLHWSTDSADHDTAVVLPQHINHGPICVSALSQFLLRVLTGWVQATDDSSCSASGTSPPALPSCGPKAEWWPSLCLDLGSLLQVNPDILRRHLVCELYNQGLDLRAEEVRGRHLKKKKEKKSSTQSSDFFI